MERWNKFEVNFNDDQEELILSNIEDVISDNIEPPFIALSLKWFANHTLIKDFWCIQEIFH